MGKSNLDAVVDHLRRLASPPRTAESDHALLARFVESRDEGAFAALLKRHGPMVFGVSRRLLYRVQDAEDVVQATFLLLARKAVTIRKRASLGCWLHGVAHRLSRQLKRQEMNRLKRDTRAWALRRTADVHAGPELQELLDAALDELPEKFRAALVACCLEGKSQEEAAKQLGCPIGTVQSRLARGRKLLQQKLAYRGLALSAAAVATWLAGQTATAALPAGLFNSALRAAMQYASGTALSGVVSSSVALLVNNGLRSLALAKMLWMSAGLVAFGLLAGGAGLVSRSAQAANQEPTTSQQQLTWQNQEKSKPTSGASDAEKPRKDRLGDPLPPGALARLGTRRFRHGELVRTLAFSADAKKLFSADGYGVYIWEAATGKLLGRLGEHQDQWSLRHASFADNGTMALVSRDGTIDIRDATTGRVLQSMQTYRFAHVRLSPDGKTLAIDAHQGGKEPHFVRLVDVDTHLERHQLTGHQDRIHAIVFSADSKTLVTSSDDKSIRFWDVATGKNIRQLEHSTLVGPVVLAPNGKTLASLEMTRSEYKTKDSLTTAWGSGREVIVWDLGTNKVAHRLRHGKWPMEAAALLNQINGLTFSPDSKTILATDRYGTHFWDAATGKELPRCLPTQWGLALAFTAHGGTLATGGNGTVQLWDMATGQEKLPRDGHESEIQSVAISPDGQTLATGGGDKQIRLWNTATGRPMRHWVGHENGTGSVAFAAAGALLVSTGYRDPVKVWDVATGKEIRRIPVAPLARSPDGRLLLARSTDKTSTPPADAQPAKKDNTNAILSVWDVETGKQVSKWAVHHDHSLVTFSADAKTIYSWDTDKKVRFWDVATGKLIRLFEGKALRADSSPEAYDRIFRWAFSADGKLVALGNQSGEIAIFDLATGEQAKLLATRWGSLSALAFSPDCRSLASSHWPDKNIHLWELATGEEFQTLTGHEGRILSLAFSADGNYLVSGSTDTTALVWDLTGTHTAAKPQRLSAKELETAWSDLAAADAVRGQKAVRALLAAPDQALGLLTKNLPVARRPEAERLTRLIRDLDSDVFKVREACTHELELLGDAVAPTLRQALGGEMSLELKQRLESLLRIFSTSQRLRTLRAVQVLEQLNSEHSHQMLARVAEGVPEALLTQEAKRAMERLVKLGARLVK